jgi:hypothetical protein
LENSSEYTKIPRQALAVNGGPQFFRENAYAQRITKTAKALKSCHTEFTHIYSAAFIHLPCFSFHHGTEKGEVVLYTQTELYQLKPQHPNNPIKTTLITLYIP